MDGERQGSVQVGLGGSNDDMGEGEAERSRLRTVAGEDSILPGVVNYIARSALPGLETFETIAQPASRALL